MYNCYDILNIILYSEIVWVVLYCYIVVVGTINDDLILISTSFFIMALAGLEFCIGFILSVFFRNFQKTFKLIESKNKSDLKLNYFF
jgi:NADH:ubiquinone oxidoreductase subunit K